MTITHFLYQAIRYAETTSSRYVAVIDGNESWYEEVLAAVQDVIHYRCVQLGGLSVEGLEYYDFNKGDLLLGQEIKFLYIDASEHFNANSINAAIGTVVGGGIVLFSRPRNSHNIADSWFSDALSEFDVLQSCLLPILPKINKSVGDISFRLLDDQKKVVEELVAIKHRRAHRPLVVTADRGRGKTTALGLAAIELLTTQSCSIVITSPRWESVKALFSTVSDGLPDCIYHNKFTIHYGNSSLRYIALDSLLNDNVSSDILFVDEASSIPLSILFYFCEHFSRLAFCSTVHGYEGCGRGFSLKFLTWLKLNRPQFKHINMEMPIRWAENDPLELWVNRTFLLSSDREKFDIDITNKMYQTSFVSFSSEQLVRDKKLLTTVFHLLIDAHYQTSPNDLMQLLSDKNIVIFGLMYKSHILGCVTIVKEPKISTELIPDISRGIRRPKGALTAVTFINQIGLADGASVDWFRVMRIAVLPEFQNRGIGSHMLTHLPDALGSNAISTSFGASNDLIHFWKNNDYLPVKMGTSRDNASGCYSLLMVNTKATRYDWVLTAIERFKYTLPRMMIRELCSIDIELSNILLDFDSSPSLPQLPLPLIINYAYGGANYEAVVIWLEYLYLFLNAEQKKQLGDVFILKVLKNLNWTECAKCLHLSGKRMVEKKLRNNLVAAIASFTL